MTKKLLFAASAAGCSFAALGAQRPNILMVVADDLGYGDVGFYGRNIRNAAKPPIATPNLDRLASEGVILCDHYCAAPVSAPSRASLLTGMRQGRCSVKDNAFDAPIRETRTLASVLRDAGYATMAIGKWGVGGGGGSRTLPMSAHPLDRGFDGFYGFPYHRAGHTYYHFDGEVNGIWMGILSDRTNATESASRVYSTDLFAARAKAYISERAASVDGKPFFLYLAINTVHGSGALGDDVECKDTLHVPAGPYPKDGVCWPVEKSPASVCNTWIDPRYASLNPKAARYATAVSRFDAAMGDIARHLEALGLAENTLIVFTSDNGPAGEYGADTRFFASAGPFDGMKRDVFEGGMRVPTFVRWPGAIAAGRDSEPSVSYDWLATFADVAGRPSAAAGTDGVSLLPRWMAPSAPHEPSFVYSQYFGPDSGGGDYEEIKSRKGAVRGEQQMIRRGAFAALRTRMSGVDTPVRLYDVVVDPFQEHDLAGEAEFAAKAEELKAELDRLYVPRNAGEPFGVAPSGEKASIYTLRGNGGLELEFTDWGGRVRSLRVPTADGLRDVTLGFDSPQGWTTNAFYAGSLIGRYANRIASGRFVLDGKEYPLACNNRPGGVPCSLHGGTRGWNDYIWKVETFARDGDVGAVLSRVSEDGEEGFPGRMRVEVVYTITADNVWRIDYMADTDKPTVFSPTHHVFFNMDGGGTILDQELMIDADRYTALDDGLIPTGETPSVEGTKFDFRSFRRIGERLGEKGYNDNWALNGSGFRRVAALRGKLGTVETWTDQPGLEVYSGNNFKPGAPTKNGGRLERYGYIALETQHYPDSPNHAEFPSTRLEAGEIFRSRTEYRFFVRRGATDPLWRHCGE